MTRGKIRPPVKWHGGTDYLCGRIIDLFPDHRTYVEPFGGAASVLLNKPLAPVELYNDLDGRLTRMFRVIRDHGAELTRQLTLTPYSEAEFNQAGKPAALADDVELVRRDIVRLRLSFGGQGESFSFTTHRVRRGMADVVSGYLSAIDSNLPLIVERFRSVEILDRPALDVIRTWDARSTLFYCDPPYLHATREQGSLDVYSVEMTEADHVELAEALNRCRGHVVLCGHSSDLYRELYRGWRVVTFEMPNNAAGGPRKGRTAETVWVR